MLMEIFIMDNFRMEKLRDLGHINVKMVINILAIGKIMNNMVLVQIFGPMALFIQDIIKIIIKMVLDHIVGQMGINILANGKKMEI